MRKLNVRNLIGLVIVLAMVTAACGAGADNADDSEVRFDTTATTEAPGAATYAGTEATTAARTAETSALNDGSVLDAQSYSGSEEATATRALSGDDYAQSGADGGIAKSCGWGRVVRRRPLIRGSSSQLGFRL